MIILINGKKRSGKNYLGSLLFNELSKKYNCTINAFADPIKEIIADSFCITLDELDELKNNKEIIITRKKGLQTKISDFRALIQKFGTEAMQKQFGKDIWSNLLMSKLKSDNINIITDFRFIKEYNTSIENDFVITINIFNNDLTEEDNHQSEIELDNFVFDYTVNNTNHMDLSDSLEYLINEINDYEKH